MFSDEHASKTISIVGDGADPTYREAFAARGGRILQAPVQEGHLALGAAFEMLGAGEGLSQPVQSMLVEAGPTLATALIQQDLVDRLFIFTSPQVLGAGIRGLSRDTIEQLDFKAANREMIGPDELVRGYLRAL